MLHVQSTQVHASDVRDWVGCIPSMYSLFRHMSSVSLSFWLGGKVPSICACVCVRIIFLCFQLIAALVWHVFPILSMSGAGDVPPCHGLHMLRLQLVCGATSVRRWAAIFFSFHNFKNFTEQRGYRNKTRKGGKYSEDVNNTRILQLISVLK